jgi:hypothetical protein
MLTSDVPDGVPDGLTLTGEKGDAAGGVTGRCYPRCAGFQEM